MKKLLLIVLILSLTFSCGGQVQISDPEWLVLTENAGKEIATLVMANNPDDIAIVEKKVRLALDLLSSEHCDIHVIAVSVVNTTAYYLGSRMGTYEEYKDVVLKLFETFQGFVCVRLELEGKEKEIAELIQAFLEGALIGIGKVKDSLGVSKFESVRPGPLWLGQRFSPQHLETLPRTLSLLCQDCN